MKQKTDLEYVELYAEKIKKDSNVFNQQKRLINSQLKASSSLFKKMFGKNFKANAREYLREIGLLE